MEDASAVNVLTGLMDQEACRWGVKIKFVKIQQVQMPGLEEVLARKKRADLQNKQVVIAAKAKKQTDVIESEGRRDAMIKEAEGEAAQLISRAEGHAQQIINTANAESRSLREIARPLRKLGENPARYLLTYKYLAALGDIVKQKGTDVQFVPAGVAATVAAQKLGMNTIFARSR